MQRVGRRAAVGWLATCFAAPLVGCDRAPDPASEKLQILVFAAASLRDALTQIQADYQRARADVAISLSFAGSNQLARQLLATSKADLFISASEEWMTRLEQAKRLVPDSRVDLLTNRLVLIGNKAAALAITGPAELADARFKDVVLGDPEAVPAGIYARKYLEQQKLGDSNVWRAIQPKLVPMPDVRAALQQVEQRRDAVGFVYTTDAALSNKVKVLYEVPESATERIVYPMAKIAREDRTAAQTAAVDALYAYLRSDAARAVFERLGFKLAEASTAGR